MSGAVMDCNDFGAEALLAESIKFLESFTRHSVASIMK